MALWHKHGPFTVFDIETTGMSPSRDRIVEIGAVRVEVDGTFTRFETLVNPSVPIPPAVSRIHGITDEMVKNAPKFTEAGYAFQDFVRGSRLVAHNARFDLSFMQESFARTGLPLLKNGAYDSIVLIKKAYPGMPSYSLPALVQAWGLGASLDAARPHRAGYDAEVTMEAFGMAMRRLVDLA
ncbi:MAG: 3'-5' exonuclease [Lentisphaeria bacterium]|nr:3'-5' exonuclease [Lentisphaeria bacterium]